MYKNLLRITNEFITDFGLPTWQALANCKTVKRIYSDRLARSSFKLTLWDALPGLTINNAQKPDAILLPACARLPLEAPCKWSK